MKRLLLSIPLSVLLFSCSQSSEDLQAPVDSRAEDSDIEITSDNPVDLSASEMANCYIVRMPGRYEFKADNQFNLGEGLPVPPSLDVKGAALVWQSVPGAIASVDLVERDDALYIGFDVEKAEGNALLSALDLDGKIIWSWHIWMPAEEVKGIKTATGYEVMNMNLGAMNNTPGDASSYGLLYQWGRKDPFPASATLTGTTATVGAPVYDIQGNPVAITNSSWYGSTDNTLDYSISHPMVCLSNYARFATSRDWLVDGDDSLWGDRKTCYDPSPAGWKVAPADVFKNLTSTGGYAWEFEDFNVADMDGDGIISLADYNYGWHFLVSDNVPLYFPAASRFDGSYAMLMGSMSGLWGNYWSSAAYPEISGGAVCCLAFQVKSQTGDDWITVSPSGGASKADAYSVRCVRDTEGGENSGIKVVRPD